MSYTRLLHLLRAGAVGLVAAASCGAWAAPEPTGETSADPVATLIEQHNVPNGAVPSIDLGDTPPPPVAAASLVESLRGSASDMVLTAMNFLGVPYRRGGTSAAGGFDCSGFTRHIFEMSLGRVLPHRADEQAKAPGFLAVARNQLKPGDLVFFNTLRRTFSHVGIYVGDGKFIHAPRAGETVRVEDMRYSYWARRFTGARRPTPASLD